MRAEGDTQLTDSHQFLSNSSFGLDMVVKKEVQHLGTMGS